MGGRNIKEGSSGANLEGFPSSSLGSSWKKKRSKCETPEL